MSGFNPFLNDPQAAKLIGDSSRLEQLKDAPETQKLFSMLSRSTGGNLEQAAGKAAKGGHPEAPVRPGGSPAHTKNEGQTEIGGLGEGHT